MTAAARHEGGNATIGDWGHDFSPLADVLREIDDGEVIYVPNPGNAGDALITKGAFDLFRRIGLKVTVGNYRETYPGRTLVYGGGGNLIGIYREAEHFFRRHLGKCPHLLLLPHSVRHNEELLASFDDRVTIVAREARSLDYIRRQAPGARTLFCHDMAFFCDSAIVQGGSWLVPGRVTPDMDDIRARLKWELKVVKRLREHGGLPRPEGAHPVINVFRTDDERPEDAPEPEGNADLPQLFFYGSAPSEFMANSAVRKLVATLQPFEVVRTNRLHIAVLASMMGKKVEVSDNNYGKLRSIYESSMADRFGDRITFLPT